MNILIVAATQFEVQPLLNFLEIKCVSNGMQYSKKAFNNKQMQVLITGAGMVNTALMMGRFNNNLHDLTLNVGVAGAFDKTIQLGELVEVTTDCLSELGAEDNDYFLTYDKLDLGGSHIFNANSNSTLINTSNLKHVKGITVNTVHGNEVSIEKIKQLYNPDIESMEGAAFFAGCNSSNQYTQIRAISNYVEKRNKSKWNMPLAIKNLNEYLVEFVAQM